MKDYTLNSDEVILFQGSVLRKKSNESKPIRTNIYLTNLNIVFEIIHKKLFSKTEIETEYISVSQIKIYDDSPQIINSGSSVKIYFLDHEEDYSFNERKEAKKFANSTYKLITGKDLGDRTAEMVKKGISKVDNALGINTMETATEILKKGLIDSLIGGKKAKSMNNAIKRSQDIMQNNTEKNSLDESVEKLKSLKELLDKGVITEEEFNIKKNEILNNL